MYTRYGKNIEITLPIIFLISLLFVNVFFFDSVLIGDYSNAIILASSGVLMFVLSLLKEHNCQSILRSVQTAFKNILIPLQILLLVGALSGAWLFSGVIPTMVYYGMKTLDAHWFLPLTVLFSALVSVLTGSSWTTSATVGLALMGIGESLGFNAPVVAGAVISGAYFGDKISPMSDTTNLAAIVSGTKLFTHIRYMLYTTIPSLIITLLFFVIYGFFTNGTDEVNLEIYLKAIESSLFVHPLLLLIPLLVVLLISLKVSTVKALFFGVVFSVLVGVYIHPKIALTDLYDVVFSDYHLELNNNQLNELFSSSGVFGMSTTIALIIAAVFFGAILEANHGVEKISQLILKSISSIFQLFFTTVCFCLGLNMITADQYLSIILSGKVFEKVYRDKNLAPENLSRTIEDSGTVTSALIPWNTCGVYQSTVLNVDTLSYLPFAIFNIVSPLTTMVFALFKLKIRTLK